MIKKICILFSLGCLLLTSCNQKKYFFEKVIEFPRFVNDEQKVKLAAYVVPTPQQLEWQEMELTAFIHFGMNTFTGNEWGDGTDSAALFNPTNFDAEQWVTTLKESGFNMIILTAKHHDGFCLWPTATTSYSVASSPWQNGHGDVVKEVKNACDKHNMKFGVYLSPWDRNAVSYGNSDEYNRFFILQLKELLTNYGEIKEVWFDGANGETRSEKQQVYDWQAYYHVIDSLQPKAVKAIMGNDIRWVGNEKGLGRETEWSVTPLNPDINEDILQANEELGISPTSKDLGSRNLIAASKKLYWYPSEVDVSIRPGWFYHPEEDHRVKSVSELIDIYYKSVGMNSVLLLNIPPDTRGQIHEIDAQRLKQFGDYIQKTFADNRITTHNSTKWQAKAGNQKEFAIRKGSPINTIMLQEDVKEGQRVEAFKVEGLFNGKWEKMTEGTTIGYKRLLKTKKSYPSKIRVTILETRAPANIKNVGAFYAPHLDSQEDVSARNNQHLPKENWVVLKGSPLVIDLGNNMKFKGFTYAPDTIKELLYTYTFRISQDGKNWTTIKKGEFGNIKNNPILQTVYFDRMQNARYIQLESIQGVEGGKPGVGLEQIGLLVK